VNKAKYIHPLLSRTNFGLLPPAVRQNPNLLEDVIVASGRATAANWNTQVNVALFLASPTFNQIHIGTWLNGIVGGRDMVNWGQDNNAARWNPAHVGPAGQQSIGHVYEFRGIANGGMRVADWTLWALSQFDYVRGTLNQ